MTSRTMASVRISRFPVARAGGIRTVVDWKFALIEQPRPQGVAQKQAARERMESATTRWARALFGKSMRGRRSASWVCVRMARCPAIMGTSSPSHARFMRSSVARGAGGGWRIPGEEFGVFSRPSLDP